MSAYVRPRARRSKRFARGDRRFPCKAAVTSDKQKRPLESLPPRCGTDRIPAPSVRGRRSPRAPRPDARAARGRGDGRSDPVPRCRSGGASLRGRSRLGLRACRRARRHPSRRRTTAAAALRSSRRRSSDARREAARWTANPHASRTEAQQVDRHCGRPASDRPGRGSTFESWAPIRLRTSSWPGRRQARSSSGAPRRASSTRCASTRTASGST